MALYVDMHCRCDGINET